MPGKHRDFLRRPLVPLPNPSILVASILMKLLSLLPLAVLLLQAGGVNPLAQQRPTGTLEGTITRANSNQFLMGAHVTVIRRLLPNPTGPLLRARG